MTKTEQIAWLRGRAEIIEASGDLALATQARAEADAMERPVCPRPAVVHKCDACGRRITGVRRIAYYAETLGVDWVLCSSCSSVDGKRFRR